MNNFISIIMFGLILAVTIWFLLKGWRKPALDKEIQKGSTFALGGSAMGFMAGLFLGATNPQIFFSDAFLEQEGAELGAIALLSIGLSVLGAICSLLIYGLLRKRQA